MNTAGRLVSELTNLEEFLCCRAEAGRGRRRPASRSGPDARPADVKVPDVKVPKGTEPAHSVAPMGPGGDPPAPRHGA
jgi:hypothetical protein